MNLPSGKQTKSQALYIREWRKYSRFLRTLDLEVIGFELPVKFVETLMTKVTK